MSQNLANETPRVQLCILPEMTYSSRIQLPTLTPPNDMPCTRLPAKLSRRGRPSTFLFGLFIDIGFAPAKESCRPLPILASKAVPLIMSESWLWKLLLLLPFFPCDDGDDEFRRGVAMSMGDVLGIIKLSVELLLSSGVKGCEVVSMEPLDDGESLKVGVDVAADGFVNQSISDALGIFWVRYVGFPSTRAQLQQSGAVSI